MSSDQLVSERRIIGGKGASLAEMINAGFPVPEPFFITSEAYDEFMRHNGLKEKIFAITNGINFSDNNSMNSASERIRDLIMNANIPENLWMQITDFYKRLYGGPPIDIDYVKPMDSAFVAVRSSGILEDNQNASSAGQYESILNVKGEKKLLEAIKRCWASLPTSRTRKRRTTKLPWSDS